MLGKAGWQQRIDLYDLLNKIIESMHKIYRDKHLQITCDNAPLNFTYPIDTTDAYELFGNILDNACKAARTTVTVTFTTEANAQIISIIDDGPGIPEALQADVLTRGKRLDTYHQGHGIGLATVSDLVEMYGATLQVISPITDTEDHIESRNEESFSEQSIVVNQASTRISVCLPNN